jgi:hypothetical protein
MFALLGWFAQQIRRSPSASGADPRTGWDLLPEGGGCGVVGFTYGFAVPTQREPGPARGCRPDLLCFGK